MAQMVASMSGVVLSGVVMVVGSNLARAKYLQHLSVKLKYFKNLITSKQHGDSNPAEDLMLSESATGLKCVKIVSEYDQVIPQSQNRRQPHGTTRKSHSTITRHQEDKLSKATSSLFPIKMIAILEWT